MNALLVAIISIAAFLMAYRFYARFIGDKILAIDPGRKTPANELNDGVDFVPTNKYVLFGHHFASIAGLAPMLGPAIGVIWGWVPALLWVVLGTIFLGGVHDFGALVVSLRNQGRSIGDIAEELIGPRARTLFLLIIFFLLSLAMGVFAYIIALLFSPAFHPQAVIPTFSLMAIATCIGWLIYRTRMGIGIPSLIGFLLMILFIWAGIKFPVTGISQRMWIIILLTYAYVASILPVWLLLQPRDYLNSFQLYVGMGLMYLGLLALRPSIVAPPLQAHPTGAPPIFPFLFITIACGAISGFHSLVSSGTTAKQLRRESEARFISFGGMIAEGLLAVAAILACTAGLGSASRWEQHYADWGAAEGLGSTIEAFVGGAGLFISQLGIPLEVAITLISVMMVAFAMTTLDSATRLLRYNIAEMAKDFHISPLSNRYLAALVAVVAIGYFALLPIGGQPAGLALWQLFGTTNQLLAGLALLAITIYLYRKKKPTSYTALPMLFMMITTGIAMVMKIRQFWGQRNIALMVVGSIIMLMAIWLGAEALLVVKRVRWGKTA